MSYHKIMDVILGFDYNPRINKDQVFYTSDNNAGFFQIRLWDLKTFVDLTDVPEIKIKFKYIDGTEESISTIDAQSKLEVVDAVGGELKYQLQTSNLSEGKHKVVVSLIDSAGDETATRPFEYLVADPFDVSANGEVGSSEVIQAPPTALSKLQSQVSELESKMEQQITLMDEVYSFIVNKSYAHSTLTSGTRAMDLAQYTNYTIENQKGYSSTDFTLDETNGEWTYIGEKDLTVMPILKIRGYQSTTIDKTLNIGYLKQTTPYAFARLFLGKNGIPNDTVVFKPVTISTGDSFTPYISTNDTGFQTTIESVTFTIIEL